MTYFNNSTRLLVLRISRVSFYVAIRNKAYLDKSIVIGKKVSEKYK